MVVIFSESFFGGMGPASWLKLRSLRNHIDNGKWKNRSQQSYPGKEHHIIIQSGGSHR
jgi:hypothetical protein